MKERKKEALNAISLENAVRESVIKMFRDMYGEVVDGVTRIKNSLDAIAVAMGKAPSSRSAADALKKARMIVGDEEGELVLTPDSMNNLLFTVRPGEEGEKEGENVYELTIWDRQNGTLSWCFTDDDFDEDTIRCFVMAATERTAKWAEENGTDEFERRSREYDKAEALDEPEDVIEDEDGMPEDGDGDGDVTLEGLISTLEKISKLIGGGEDRDGR